MSLLGSLSLIGVLLTTPSEELSLEQLASKAGISRTSAYRHFAACQQICTSRCIDKKGGKPSPIDKSKEPSGTTSENKNKTSAQVSNIRIKEDINMVFMRSSETEDDDIRLIEEHQAWLLAQESCETHQDSWNEPDITFESTLNLTRLETPF